MMNTINIINTDWPLTEIKWGGRVGGVFVAADE